MGKIFISYSHKDKARLDELLPRFRALENAGFQIAEWNDRRLETGTKWRDEISSAISEANVAVMLISPAFLASKFIIGNEVPPLLRKAAKGRCRIMPLLVRPTNTGWAKWLDELQIHMPEGKSVIDVTGAKRDRLLNDFAEGVRKHVAKVRRDQQAKRKAANRSKTATKPPKRVPSKSKRHRKKQAARKAAVPTRKKWSHRKSGPQQPRTRNHRSSPAGRSAAPQAPKTDEGYATAGSGMVLIGDIAHFTELSEDAQRSVIEFLWKYLEEHSALRRHEHVRHLFADHVMVAFTRQTNSPITPAEVVAFAEGLQTAMQKQNAPLRIGIHLGEFSWSAVRGHAFGSAINHCQKMRHLGSDNTILVSERFVEAWADHQGEDYRQRVHPGTQVGPDSGAYAVTFRNGRGVKFRVLKIDGRDDDVPQGVAFLTVVGKRIRESLELIEGELVSGIAQTERVTENQKSAEPKPAQLTSEEITAKRMALQIRVSLLAPTTGKDGRRFLSSTKFRHLLNGDAKPTTGTVYSADGPGTGPAGRAFVANQTLVCSHLPDPGHGDEYAVELNRTTGLALQTIANFGRKARTFIEIPFALAESGGESWRPDGVICIDSLAALENIPLDELQRLADNLRDKFADLIAFLWALHQRP